MGYGDELDPKYDNYVKAKVSDFLGSDRPLRSRAMQDVTPSENNIPVDAGPISQFVSGRAPSENISDEPLTLRESARSNLGSTGYDYEGPERPTLGTSYNDFIRPMDSETIGSNEIPGRKLLPNGEGYMDLGKDWNADEASKVNLTNLRSYVAPLEYVKPGPNMDYYSAHPEERDALAMSEIMNPGMTDAERSKDFRDRQIMESSFASPVDRKFANERMVEREKAAKLAGAAVPNALGNYVGHKATAETARITAASDRAFKVAELTQKANDGNREAAYKLARLQLDSVNGMVERAAKIQEMKSKVQSDPVKLKQMEEDIYKTQVDNIYKKYQTYALDAHKYDEAIKTNPMDEKAQALRYGHAGAVDMYEQFKSQWLRLNPGSIFPPKMPDMLNPTSSRPFPIFNAKTGQTEMYVSTPDGVRKLGSS